MACPRGRPLSKRERERGREGEGKRERERERDGERGRERAGPYPSSPPSKLIDVRLTWGVGLG